MVAGGMGRLASGFFNHTLGRNLSFFAPILSETLGIGTEAAAFTLFTNPSQSAFTHHFTNFSILRMAAFLGRGSGLLFQHAFESAGMVLADQVTGANVEKTLTQRLMEASVFGIQNRISMAAAHVLCPIAFHHYGSTPLIGHKNFRDLIEPLLPRRTSPGFLAAKIGLATFIHERFAAANPLKDIAHHVHEHVGTIPLVMAGLGLAIYLSRKLITHTLWAPHPEVILARELIEKNSTDISAFFRAKWWHLNSFFRISNGHRIAFRGGLSRLGVERCTLLGLLKVKGHSFPVAVKWSAQDVSSYKTLLQTHPMATQFFPHLYGIAGDFIISKRLEGIEDKPLEKLATGDSLERQRYISNAWALVRSVYQAGLRFEYDVDLEQGSNLIFNPKTGSVHLLELGSLKVPSEVPGNALNYFLAYDYYGQNRISRPFSGFDYSLIEEALRQQKANEAPFTLSAWRLRNDQNALRMDDRNLQLYRAFKNKVIRDYGRVSISIENLKIFPPPKDEQPSLVVALEDIEPASHDTFRLRPR